MEARLRAFIEARCDCGEGMLVSRQEFREAFNAWDAHEPVYRGFQVAVESLGYPAATRAYGAARKPTAVYSNISLTPVIREHSDEEMGEVSMDGDCDEEMEPSAGHPDQEMERTPAEGGSDEAVDPVAEPLLNPVTPTALHGQLVLVGEYSGVRMRLTDHTPPTISILDLIAAVTGCVNPSDTWEDVSKFVPDVQTEVTYHQFKGRGQRKTPVINARGAVMIMNYLQGPRAARFRTFCADVVVRYLEGDESLVGEIRRNASVQPIHTLAQLQTLPPVKDNLGGMVYVVTSDLVDVVKIGMWKGGHKRLEERYRCYYGPRLDMKTIKSVDCRKLETLAHEKLSDMRIAGELYRKGTVDYELEINNIQKDMHL
jgi:hypothetical protein